MHTIALTVHNDIITWGFDDNHALGRDTGGKVHCTILTPNSDDSNDSNSDNDEEGEWNPLESSPPTKVSAKHFPPDNRFVQVAAGDSCSFALTETGLAYG